MQLKITNITSESFEWERPGIWNGMHFYGPGRLHKVTIFTNQGIHGIGWNGVPIIFMAFLWIIISHF